MRLRELDGCRVLIWGMGREGQAAAALLADPARSRPVMVTTMDDGAREVLGPERPLVDLDGVDVVVKSPGVTRYRPEIEAFRERGGIVTSLTDLVLSERAGRMTIGVTGTKGKSTTASLIAHLIGAAGVPVELAGNIGRAPVEVLDTTDRWIVLECSSYQCADVSVSPQVGVFTSIYEEHLDWHGSYERYVADKLNLFRTSETTFVNGMQDAAVEVTAALPGRRLVTDANLLVPLGGLRLRGEHNERNANLAVHAAAHALGGVHPGFAAALASFEPLEHRLQTIGRYGNLTVVDDGLATAPGAVGYALDVFADRSVVLLVGGYDRALDYTDFGADLANRPSVRIIAMGPAGVRIADAVEGAAGVRPTTVPTLAAAIDHVDSELDGVLLLSPAATSYGEYADYRARGQALRLLLTERGMRPSAT